MFTNDSLVDENVALKWWNFSWQREKRGYIYWNNLPCLLYLALVKQVRFQYSGALAMGKNEIYFNIALSDNVICSKCHTFVQQH